MIDIKTSEDRVRRVAEVLRQEAHHARYGCLPGPAEGAASAAELALARVVLMAADGDLVGLESLRRSREVWTELLFAEPPGPVLTPARPASAAAR